jgi:predicted PurR-regulated permease PerM
MEQTSFIRRLSMTLGLIILVGLLLVFFWRVADILLLVFVSILLAVFLSGFAGAITRYTRLPRGFSLAFTVLVVLSLLVGATLLIGPRIIEQSDDLVEGIERALRGMVTTLSNSPQGQWLLEQTPLLLPENGSTPTPSEADSSQLEDASPEDAQLFPSLGDLSSGIDVLAGVFGILPSVLSALANILFVIVLAIFFAASPGLYLNGLLRLFPESQRKRAGEVLLAMGHTLRAWLFGQFISMVSIGVVVGVGLWLLGLPFALTLAFLAFLLEFIPIVGSFLSAVPGILIAFTQGWTQVIAVTVFYLVVQQLEGNLLTPLIHQRVVDLPPALTLVAVLIMGTFFGFVGLLVATPLLAVVMVLVKMLYLKDTLGQKVELANKGL